MIADDPLLLPEGTRLLHVGPHKTGTSSLQSAFHLARRQVAGHGVHYAGRNRQPTSAAQAAAALPGTTARRGDGRAWPALVQEIQSTRAGRVVISSEWFADAGDPAIRMIAEALNPSRLHVVLTIRPLATILPSQWQQYVQGGATIAFEPWLEGVLERPGSITPSFWVRHRHDELASRWAQVVGPERVTVVVADERDRGAILQSFERLVGLPAGLLVPEDIRANRSLTLAEIELIRAINLALDESGVDRHLKHKLVFSGAARRLKRRMPGGEEPRIQLPGWAHRSIAEAARSIVDGLRGSGVRVVGDLESLAAPPVNATRPVSEAGALARWPEVTGLGTMGIVIEGGLAHGAGRRGARGDLSAIHTVRLRNAFVSRVRRAVRRRPRPHGRSGRDPGPPSPIHSSPEVE